MAPAPGPDGSGHQVSRIISRSRSRSKSRSKSRSRSRSRSRSKRDNRREAASFSERRPGKTLALRERRLHDDEGPCRLTDVPDFGPVSGPSPVRHDACPRWRRHRRRGFHIPSARHLRGRSSRHDEHGEAASRNDFSPASLRSMETKKDSMS